MNRYEQWNAEMDRLLAIVRGPVAPHDNVFKLEAKHVEDFRRAQKEGKS